jgi:hydrogenase expression/formation protein HypC
MCLAVPGKLTSINAGDPLTRTGTVDFSGIFMTVNLAFAPEAAVEDYVLVHAGIAIGTINKEEAARVMQYLAEISQSATEDDHR